MKTLSRLVACCSLPTAVLVGALSAQSVPPPPATAPAGNATVAKEVAILLTPFEVSSAKDTGYLASQTLSGTRLNTKIEDTGVAETIITPDFMRDLEPVTGLDDGTGKSVTIRWRVPEPRTFALSNTLEF
jgi:hypothetical protein